LLVSRRTTSPPRPRWWLTEAATLVVVTGGIEPRRDAADAI
jgi:hypothetical protein